MRKRERERECLRVPWNDLRVEEEVERVIKDPLLPYQMATPIRLARRSES